MTTESQLNEAWRRAAKEIIDRWVAPDMYEQAMAMLDLAMRAACGNRSAQPVRTGLTVTEPKLCDYGNQDDFDDAHDDWERRQQYQLIGAMEYNGNTVSYMYSKAKNYGDALVECCNLIGGTGHIRDRIRRLLAERDALLSAAQQSSKPAADTSADANIKAAAFMQIARNSEMLIEVRDLISTFTDPHAKCEGRHLVAREILPKLDAYLRQPACADTSADARDAELLRLRHWFETQRKAISKGCGSSWDMGQCDDQIDLIDAAIAASKEPK